MNPAYLVILSVIGFGISFYLYYSKTRNKKLVCMVGDNCDDVVKSRWGKTFGVENTIPGMAYYFIILVYASSILPNQNIFKGNIVYYLIVGISACTVLFSTYLTGVQAFVLKKWCEYCIISSICSVLILITLLI